MSVKVMTWVWDHAPVKSGELVVLLKLADNAHDDGTNARPSQAYLAERSRLKERQVRNCLDSLETKGLIVRTGVTEKGIVVWQIPMTEVPRQTLPGGNGVPGDPGNGVPTEPSVEPSGSPPDEPYAAYSDDLLEANTERFEESRASASNGTGKLLLVDSEPTRLAAMLSATVRQNMETPPGSKKYAPTTAWAAEIEKMHRLDGRSWEEIERCVRWLRDGSDRIAAFWRSNIRSAKKLREKYDTMAAQLRSEKAAARPSRGDQTHDMLARMHAEALAEEAATR